MNDVKRNENLKEDKKYFGKFAGFILVCAVLGFAVGVLGVKFYKNIGEITSRLMEFVGMSAPAVQILCTTAVACVTFVFLRKGRREFAAWDGEEEKTISRIEDRINLGMMLCSLNIILTYFLFGAGFYYLKDREADPVLILVRMGIQIAGILYMVVVSMVCQKQQVNLEKEINPEKHGSVYDLKFAKRWMESCDEAEMLRIYKAAYHSFQTMNMLFVIMSVFCLLGVLLFDFGIMPLMVVSVLWAVMQISYCMEEKKSVQ